MDGCGGGRRFADFFRRKCAVAKMAAAVAVNSL